MDDAVVLTAYFSERREGGSALAGGSLLDLCMRRSVAASLVLRGVGGYGPGQLIDAGRPGPLPEDPPTAAIAVDTAPRIGALIDDVATIVPDGLIVLERARLLSGEIGPVSLSESFSEATMLTIYCRHSDQAFQIPAFEAACELLHRREVAGATVLSAIDGSTRGQRQRGQFLRHRTGIPLMVIAVGSSEQIGPILPELGGLFRDPLMTVARVHLCKRDGQLISRPETLPGTDVECRAGMSPLVKLTVYLSEAARVNGEPVHRAMVRQLRSAGVGTATSHRGTWGFHGERAPHGDHFPRPSRHVPVVTTVIERQERIGVAFDIVDALTPERGLLTAEGVLTAQRARVTSD